MDKVTLTLRPEQVQQLDDADFESRSEAARMMIDRGFEYEDLEQENERLRNEKRTILNQRDENKELVEYLRRERELQLEERERRRDREQQPVWLRLRDWVLGRE